MSGRKYIAGQLATKTLSMLRASLDGRQLWTAELDTSPTPSWRDEAKCLYYPLEWFFGDEREVKSKHAEPRTNEQTRIAKSICAECPVQFECRVWAYNNGYRWGVFGGETEHERKRFRAKMRNVLGIEVDEDEEVPA